MVLNIYLDNLQTNKHTDHLYVLWEVISKGIIKGNFCIVIWNLTLNTTKTILNVLTGANRDKS